MAWHDRGGARVPNGRFGGPIMALRAFFRALAGLAALGGSAFAQDANSDIIVPGERLEQMAREFVAEISEAPQSEDQFARWNDRICPGAVGLTPEAAQVLIDRISARAQYV